MSVKFHLPDFWSQGPLNLALIDMIKEHPEYFYGYSPILVGSGYPENHCKPIATLDRT